VLVSRSPARPMQSLGLSFYSLLTDHREFFKKHFLKNRIHKCVDKAEIGGRYRYLTKAWGRGRPPLCLNDAAVGCGHCGMVSAKSLSAAAAKACMLAKVIAYAEYPETCSSSSALSIALGYRLHGRTLRAKRVPRKPLCYSL
jgi:hypothetical protein